MRTLLGLLLGLVARAWLATLRVQVVEPRDLPRTGTRPWILCFFHGTQFPLLAWPRRRGTVALVSLSRDGDVQARALAWQGLGVVRGSSSRGGARGLAALVRRIRRGEDAAFAVDGPRGPEGRVKPGAVAAARAAGGLLVPLGSASERAWVAVRAWDHFVLPLPFTRVAVHVGAPIELSGRSDEEAAQYLEGAISASNRAAALSLK